ncbi:MAG: hypothetical protein M3Q15_07760 [Pseudomonadota bacterium]|nr:hypothetical protein [Pseudomonadota bacterium]
MPDERAIIAISRIEHALARVEAAAGRDPPTSDGALEELRGRHGALRGKIEGAIAQIDGLLDRHGEQ